MPEPSQHVTSLTGGVSDTAVLYISIIGFVVLGIAMHRLIFAKLDSDAKGEDELNRRDYDEDLDEADVGTLNRAQRRARAKNRMKKKRRIEPARRPPGAVPDGEEEEAADAAIVDAADAAGDGLEEDDIGGTRPIQNMSRRERQRVAKAAEKEERRRYVIEREAALKKQDREETYLERREREKAEEDRIMKERRIIEKERKDTEWKEYEEWRTMFSDGRSGETIFVKDFVAYLEKEKVVDIDDIADQYGLRTNVVIKRLKELVEEGRLNGTINDRGEFIYLSSEDMDSMANIVRKKGRITLEDLASECSNVISRHQSHNEKCI